MALPAQEAARDVHRSSDRDHEKIWDGIRPFARGMIEARLVI